MLMQEIGAALRACSIGGDAAGRLAEDAFGIVTMASNDPAHDAALVADLADAIRGAGIPDGQVAPRIARIDLSLGGLSDEDAGRALTYAMSSFVKSLGGSLDIGSLQDGLAAAMTEAVSRFVDTRRILADERFTLVYQPVVDIATRAIHHYEALTRFRRRRRHLRDRRLQRGRRPDHGPRSHRVQASDQGHGAKRQRQCGGQPVRPVGAE